MIKINTIYTKSDIEKFLNSTTGDPGYLNIFFEGEDKVFSKNSLPTKVANFKLVNEIQFSIELENQDFFTANDLMNHISKSEAFQIKKIEASREQILVYEKRISEAESHLNMLKKSKEIVSKSTSIKQIFSSIINCK